MISLPVQVEQIAAAIRAMNASERQSLMALVPELRLEAAPTLPNLDTDPWLQALRADMAGSGDDGLWVWNQTFFGGYTLGQYMALSDDSAWRTLG